MSLITCPECGKEISNLAHSCPNCGFPLSELNKTSDPPADEHTNEDTNTCEPVNNSDTATSDNHTQQPENLKPETNEDLHKFNKYIFAALAAIIVIVFVFAKISATNESNNRKRISQLKLDSAKVMLNKDSIKDSDWPAIKELLDGVLEGTPQHAEAQRILTEKVQTKLDEISEREAEKARAEERKAEEALLSPRGKKIRAKHPDWDVDTCNTIAKGQIQIGMTTHQVAAAWGRPYDINRTTADYGTHEQWVMHEGVPTSYVYFENGICTAIQN
jgi:hypothetical protein